MLKLSHLSAWSVETGEGRGFIVAHPSSGLGHQHCARRLYAARSKYQGQKCSAPIACLHSALDLEEPSRRARRAGRGDSTGRRRRLPELHGSGINRRQGLGNHERSTSRKGPRMPKSSPEARRFQGSGSTLTPPSSRQRTTVFKLLREDCSVQFSTIYRPFADSKYEETLELCDKTSPYGLTGAIFATDRSAIRKASETLVNAAGNFYINDKPTGAVVGLQPFGGARASGTNDKAGSFLNLIRWTSPRTIKETYVPPTDHRYPYMDAG